MIQGPAWLPPLMTMASFGGVWERYCEALYAIFKADFISSRPFYEGRRIAIRSMPIEQGKEVAFWHLISDGNDEDSRVPDMRRCERIGWIRPCIEHCRQPEFKIWTSVRKGKHNICIWLDGHDYLVVLGVRRGYYLLLTAYPVTIPNRKRKLMREYESYKANAAR